MTTSNLDDLIAKLMHEAEAAAARGPSSLMDLMQEAEAAAAEGPSSLMDLMHEAEAAAADAAAAGPSPPMDLMHDGDGDGDAAAAEGPSSSLQALVPVPPFSCWAVGTSRADATRHCRATAQLVLHA